jgi:hypothetical protein
MEIETMATYSDYTRERCLCQCVNTDVVERLLKQRDIARREKHFSTAERSSQQRRV